MHKHLNYIKNNDIFKTMKLKLKFNTKKPKQKMYRNIIHYQYKKPKI